ncbi:MAG: Flp pilus assembly complex ATPase component TadA [Candidatus Thermoplasmatota archaeon]|nr:Flp pilus assembly complex ATPase component TadA [Candidatus Thermoplasmatota archaeon]MBS3789308.1 Flp pilus assembly complex ATPase component TadA [Candidatus Thermoplasmatota archaeon]
MKIVSDTSVIVDGRITSKLEDGVYRGADIIIPEAVIFELESQANRGQETGMSGLEEIQELKKFDEEGEINLFFKGKRPGARDQELASSGEIDSMIRSIAMEENAILLTSDIVQAEVGRAKGCKIEYLEPEIKEEEHKNEIVDYFDEDVMSIHLRKGIKPKAKKGIPGDIRTEVIGEEVLTEKDLQDLARNIIENAKRSSDGFIEVDKGGATVVQLEDIRIVISRPPFSDGFEITAVRPVAKVSLEDYRMSEELKGRLSERQRGVLLAGSPGAGKSTLAQAIAEYLKDKEFTVKTMEDPRDLQVGDDITQYSGLDGKMENTADILLLVRPDYTIYDEVRKTPHFKVFADMRLAGVGMIGVTHANRAIDALQRLIGRIELGMVPQVVDTIVFVEEAQIRKVYDITYTVKVPEGMVEEDLARPVIEVRDFESGVTEYEVYSYGEQVVVMPVEGKERSKPVHEIAEKEIKREINRYVSGRTEVEVSGSDRVTVYVPDSEIPRLLGKNGKNISRIEDHLGLKIDVQPLKDRGERGKVVENKTGGESVDVLIEKEKVIIEAGRERVGKTVDLFSGNEYLSTVTVGQDGSIKIRKGTRVAQQLIKDVNRGKDVKIVD